VFDGIRTDGPWATIYTRWLCGQRPNQAKYLD
jgi:hypothetical protein